jgi:hypothetical protein
MAIRRSPRLEELSSRVLPSVTVLPTLPAPAHVEAAHMQHSHLLHGKGEGNYLGQQIIADAGQNYQLSGKANLAGLGSVVVTGSVHGVGFVAHGHAGGELKFSNAHGSVTIDLVGPLQAGFANLPHQFSFHTVASTGSYHGMHVSGTLQLILTPDLHGVVPHGTFRLVI